MTLPQPAPVLGPPGSRLSGAVTAGVPYVPTRATVSGPETAAVTLERRFQGLEAGPAAVIFDPRFSIGHRLSERLHGSGHLGWWMAGIELRLLVRDGPLDSPVVVAVGAQLDAPAMAFGLTDAAIWDVRAQVSMHPTIAGGVAMLGAGVSGGRQKHDLHLPDGPLARGTDAGYAAPVLLRALRPEARLEGVVGVSFGVAGGRIALAAQPFYVVAQGAVSTLPCGGCLDDLRVDSLDASWGAAFTITFLGSAP